MRLPNILLAWEIKHLFKGIIAKAREHESVITKVYHVNEPWLAIPKWENENYTSRWVVQG